MQVEEEDRKQLNIGKIQVKLYDQLVLWMDKTLVALKERGKKYNRYQIFACALWNFFWNDLEFKESVEDEEFNRILQERMPALEEILKEFFYTMRSADDNKAGQNEA